MSNNEAQFELDEMFFSATDKKGIIQYGNSVFVRISEYVDEEVFKKPHNVIRHHDMPKIIFKLFWTYLLSDKPIVAYVKNKTKTGKYYWVLALAFPTNEGFLSIRLKPSSHYLKIIEDLYEELLKLEQNDLNFTTSTAFMVEKLKDLGFNSYDDFMIIALDAELNARNELLSQKKNHHHILDEETDVLTPKAMSLKAFTVLPDIYELLNSLITSADELREIFNEIDMISKNMLIGTMHLGKAARTAATISENLQHLTCEIQQGSSTFTEKFQSFRNEVQKISFIIMMTYFQIEMRYYTDKMDSKNHTTDMHKHYANEIEKIIKANCDLIVSELKKLFESQQALTHSISDFTRVSLGMNVICISGKIEIAHLSSDNDVNKTNVQDVSEQLQNMRVLNDKIASNLKNINKVLIRKTKMNQQILGLIKQLREADL